MFVFSVGNIVMRVVTRFYTRGLGFEVIFRFLVKHATLEASADVGGDSRNFANLQIVNETANTMFQQCRLSWF
jgi:hypothetical protein